MPAYFVQKVCNFLSAMKVALDIKWLYAICINLLICGRAFEPRRNCKERECSNHNVFAKGL